MIGLGDVVLGELVEEVRLVVAGIDRGEDDDRQVGPGLDLAGEGQAVHARHHQVDDQQIGPGAVEASERLVAVARGRDLEAVEPKLLGERDEQTAVVIHEQDPWDRRAVAPRGQAAGHGPSIGPAVTAPWGPRSGSAARSGQAA